MKMRWIGILALACACSMNSTAQPPAPDAGIVGIGHVAFRVSDLDREIDFLGKLGYEESFGIPGKDGKVMEVFVKVNDRQFIEIYAQADPPQPLGWMHVCYEVGDLNVLYKFYESTGLKLQPVRKAGAGNLISAVNDPDGRVTEFTQYMPGSRHMLDRGQHLGPHRVSEQLLGFSLPVADGVAQKEFYTDLGFEAEETNGNVHLRTPSAPDMRIELRPALPGATPQVLFTVPDARHAAKQLKDAGLKAERQGKLVFVHDPDGNMFVFLEAGTGQR